MAFRGETAQIPLVNIFQTLSLSSQKGVLQISWRDTTHRIRFLGGAVRAIPDSPGDVEPLRGLLVKMRVLTEAQFGNVRAALPPDLLLGDALLDRRIVTPEQLAGPLRSQFEELILLVFTWPDATFHFTAGQGSDADEFFSPDKGGAALTFDVTSILMESACREDEWARIRGVIPDPHEIFVPVDRATFAGALAELAVNDTLAEELAQLLDGENDLTAVVRASSFSAFRVFQPVATLLGRGGVRRLSAEEKKALAEKHRRQFRFQEAAAALRSALKDDPDDVDAREGLALILGRLRETEELIVQWRHLAERSKKAGNLAEAKNYLNKILAQAPDHLAARADLYAIHRAMGKEREALDAARRLVQAARTHDDAAEAHALIERCAADFPGELSFKHALAASCFRCNDRQRALTVLNELAAAYQKTGALANLRRTYEQIVKVDPQASRRLAYIIECEKRQYRAYVKRIRRFAVRAVGAFLLIFIVVYAIREVSAYRSFAAAKRRAREAIADGRFADASRIVDAITAAYPYSTAQLWVQKLGAEVEEAAKVATDRDARLRRERQVIYEGRIMRANDLIPKGEWEEAWRILESIPAAELEPKQKDEVLALNAKLRTYLDAAGALARQALKAEDDGKWREAFLFWQELTDKYPNAPQSKTMCFPLQVATAPPRAEIYLDDKLVALSPQIIRWSPSKPVELVIRKRSYLPFRKMLENLNDVGWSLGVSLQRLASWTHACDGVVEARAASLGDRMVIADRRGIVYALNVTTGVPLWRVSLGDIGGVSVDPKVWRGQAVATTVDGTVTVLSRDGEVTLRCDVSRLGPIRLTPSDPTEDGLIAVVSESGELSGCSLADGSIRWTARMPGKVRVHPVERDGSVHVADVAGNIWRFDAASGNVLSRRRCEGAVVLPPIALSASSLVVALEGKLLAAGGAEERTAPLLAPPIGMAAGDGAVYVATKDQYLSAFAASDLVFLWKIKLPDLATAVATTSGSVYCACGDQIVAIDRNGQLVWRFQGTERIGVLTALGSNHLVAMGEGRSVLLFDLAADR